MPNVILFVVRFHDHEFVIEAASNSQVASPYFHCEADKGSADR
jgi:hypothetical protein